MTAHKIEGHMKPSTETRLALLEQSNIHFTETLKRIDNNIVAIAKNTNDSILQLSMKLESKIDLLEKKMDSKFDLVDKKFERLENKIDGNFKYIITTMLTLFVLNGVMPAIVTAIQKFLS